MAAFEQTLLALDVLSVLFVFLALVFIKKNREFEVIELENSVNAMLFGAFVLFITMGIQVLFFLNVNFASDVEALLPGAERYFEYLNTIVDLGLLPLFSICFLVGVLLVRDVVTNYKGALPEHEEETSKKQVVVEERRGKEQAPHSVVFKTKR